MQHVFKVIAEELYQIHIKSSFFYVIETCVIKLHF